MTMPHESERTVLRAAGSTLLAAGLLFGLPPSNGSNLSGRAAMSIQPKGVDRPIFDSFRGR